jgi:hypothetical protein
VLKLFFSYFGFSFIDLDTPLLLSEDPVYGGYEGRLGQNLVKLQFPVHDIVMLFISYTATHVSVQCFVIENHSIL